MHIRVTKNVEEANLITHNGTFHADEVLATAILCKVVKNPVVCRIPKVPENLDNEVIVYDIGLGEFDHHQKNGNGVRENGIPYASCGLIWKKFGNEILRKYTDKADFVQFLIDRDFIQGIDAIDSGEVPKAKSYVNIFSFSQCISTFNPTWDSDESADKAFVKAVKFADIVLENILKNTVSKAKATGIIEEAIENSEDHILVLDKYVSWKSVIPFSENEKAKDIWFVVYPSNRGEGYNWQCVPDKKSSSGQRKSVPFRWRGLTAEELRRVTGIKTATFCHYAGFIGGAETLEDTIEFVKLAIES